MNRISREDLLKEAAKFDYWFFPYDLGDGKMIRTTHPAYNTMHYKKVEHILDPAIDLISRKDLKGMRVLDCGCNSGFFSFECAKRNADYVLGLEGKDKFVKQARLLNDYFQFSNLEFRKEDVSAINIGALGQFDLVLLMGVLYYLENPISFMREIGKITKSDVIIDSEVVPLENATFNLLLSTPDHFGGLRNSRLIPSVGALKALLYMAGFKSYRVLNTDNIHNEYKKFRISLVASKERRKNLLLLEPQSFIIDKEWWSASLSSYVLSDKRF